jgi:hypothetical protein
MIPEMNNIVNGNEYAASFDTFDYCPVAQAVGVSVDISDKNEYTGQVSFMERDVAFTQTRRCSSYVDGLRRSVQLSAFGEIYGPSSACFESTLSVTGGVTRGAKLPRPIGAGCFQYECDKQNPGTLYIIINGTASNGDVSRSEVLYHKVLCDYRRGRLSFSVPSFDGVIVCPEGGADVLCREPEVVDVPYPLSMLVNRTSPLVSILPTPSNSPTISTTPSGSSSFKLPSATPSETPSGSTSPGPMCVTAVLVLENVYAENVTSKLSNFSSQTMPIYAALINYSSTFVKVASVKQVQKQIEVRARRLSDNVLSPLFHPLYQSENSTDTVQRSLATTTPESCYCTNATLYNVTGMIVPSSRNCSSGPGSNSALYNPLSTATASTPYLGTCSNTTISSADSQLILIIRYYAYVSIDTLAATSTVNDVIANIVKGFLPPQEMSSWDAYFNTQETIRLSLLDELTEKISNVIGISKSSFSLYLLSTPTAKAGLGSFDIPPLPPNATDNSVLLALVGSLLPFLLIFAFLAGIEWLKRFREKMIAIREINPILLPEDRSTVAKPAPKNFLPRSLWNLETRLRQERIEKIELGHLEPMTEEEMKNEVKAHAECIRMKKKWNSEEWKKDYEVSKMLITASEGNEVEKGSTEKSERLLQEDDVIVSENDSVFKTKVSVEVPTVLFFNMNESKVDAKPKKMTGKDVHNVHEGSEDVVPVSTPRNVHTVPLPTLTSFLTHSQPADNDHVLLHVDDLHFDSFTNNDIVKYQEKVAGLTKTDIRPETASSADSRHNEVASHVSTLLPELQQKAKEAGNTCESMRQEVLELLVYLNTMSITPKQRRITTEKLTELRKGLIVAEARSARANAALASVSAIAFAQVSTAGPTSKNVSDDHHNEVETRKTSIGIQIPLDRSEFGLFTHLDARALIPIFSELQDYEKPGYSGELSQEENGYPPPSACDLCRVRRAMRTCYNCDHVPVIMTDHEMSSTSFLEDIASSTGNRSLPNPKGTKLRFLHTCVDCFVFTHGKNINMRLHSFADLTNVDSRLTEYAPGGPLHKLLLDRAAAAQQYAETTIKTFVKSSKFEIDDRKDVDLEDVDVEDGDSTGSEVVDEEGSEDDSDYINNSVGYQEEGKETDEDKELMIGVEGKECEGKESEDLYRQVQHESKEEEKKNEELGDASPTNEEGDIPGRVIQW